MYFKRAWSLECEDGYVLVDPRSNPDDRLFAIPFNKEVKFKHYSIKASEKGMSPPLTFKYPNGKSFEYFADIANGDDAIMKEYMIFAVHDFVPIVVYNKDGTAFKNIKILPNEGKIVLTKHAFLKQNNIISEVSFDTLRKEGFAAVAEFMGSDFHVSIKEVYEQLKKFIFHHEKVMKVFSSTIH